MTGGRSVGAPRNVPVAVTLHRPRIPLGRPQAEASQSVPAPARASSANSRDAGLSSGRTGNGSISLRGGSGKLKGTQSLKTPGTSPLHCCTGTVTCKLPLSRAELRMTTSTLFSLKCRVKIPANTDWTFSRFLIVTVKRLSFKFNFKGDVEEKEKCF